MKKDGNKEILERGVEEVIEKNHLEKALKSGKKLRVKLGIDPTSPDIHIGRAVVLWKLRAFQDLGHKAVLIIGDFTGLIGDTSDKDAERPMMSEKEIKSNMKTYFEQAFKVLDKNKTETHYNSEWLSKLGFKEIGEMADSFGLHEFEAREAVARRIKAGKRVSLREVLYPIMQGYDSVAVRSDVELGGTDQKFNLLAGRDIQKLYGQKSQDIMTLVLLEGKDGRKMSSSWGNVINLNDEPDEMFGKVMSINDELIKKYFLLATNVEERDIKKIISKNKNPRDQKLRLAREIVALYHGKDKAVSAERGFEKKFGKAKGEIKADKTLQLRAAEKIKIIDEVLVRSLLVSSKSEARRKIQEGAVELNGKKIHNPKLEPKFKKGDLIRLGKRFLRIK
jgi:tyrosyl-tRNA synthetase